VRIETLGEELGEDASCFGGREDRVQGGARHRAVIGMVQVLVAVPPRGRIAAHDDVRALLADDPREIAPEGERRLDDAVLVAEEHDVLHAEDPCRVVKLALATGNEAVSERRVLVGAGAAGGDEAERDGPALARPAGHGPRDRELDVVRMRGDAEDRAERVGERVRASCGRHAARVYQRAAAGR
jgi:hypothetical protein